MSIGGGWVIVNTDIYSQTLFFKLSKQWIFIQYLDLFNVFFQLNYINKHEQVFKNTTLPFILSEKH